MLSEPRAIRRSLSLIALLVAVTLFARLVPGERIIDDSYITYRYAANVADGVGFVYNSGERVLGTTTPLYTLILTIAYWITGASLPTISVLLNALLDGIGVILLFLLGSRIYTNWLPAFILSMLWAVAPRSVTFAVGGLETSLYVTLILASFAAYLDGKSTVASALTGLAVLTRPDALIWAGPLGIAMIVQRWRVATDAGLSHRLPWTELAVFLAIVLPWIVFGMLTFGSPLSNSVAAKSVSYQLPPTQGLSAVIQTLATPFFEFDTFGPRGAIIGSLVYLVLSLLGAMFTIYDDRRTWPLVLFPWLHVTVFAVANPLIFRWYLTPMLPIYFLLLMGGVWGAARRAGREVVASVVATLAGVFWLILSLNAWVAHPDSGPDRPAPDMAWIGLEERYEEAGRYLADRIDPDAVVAAADIGAVGWFTRAPLLDTLGLVSPQSVDYYPVDPRFIADAPYAIAPDLIADLQPDYLVILEVYGRNGIMQDTRFTEEYRLMHKIETDIYNSDGMLIFERVE